MDCHFRSNKSDIFMVNLMMMVIGHVLMKKIFISDYISTAGYVLGGKNVIFDDTTVPRLKQTIKPY